MIIITTPIITIIIIIIIITTTTPIIIIIIIIITITIIMTAPHLSSSFQAWHTASLAACVGARRSTRSLSALSRSVMSDRTCAAHGHVRSADYYDEV
jgi:hypothetical protein